MASDTDALLLSHPFRLRPDGSVATVLDGTDQAHAEGIVALALTRRGERPYVPDFGTSDPTFDTDIDMAELNAALAVFGPPVTVTTVTGQIGDDGWAQLTVGFDDDTQPDTGDDL